MSPYRAPGRKADPDHAEPGAARAMALVALAVVIAIVVLRPEAPPSPRSGAMGMVTTHGASTSRGR